MLRSTVLRDLLTEKMSYFPCKSERSYASLGCKDGRSKKNVTSLSRHEFQANYLTVPFLTSNKKET